VFGERGAREKENFAKRNYPKENERRYYENQSHEG
jgi:hypothetical protein